jgi:F-type H+-transporting ATPase subunit epsilon
MNEFHLTVVTPDGTEFDGMATSLLVKTDSGDVEILANHADYFASLGIGRARIEANGEKRIASSAGGFLSVKKNEVMLVATTFEFANEIDVERALQAKEEAEESIARSDNDKTLTLAKAKLARAMNRINVSEFIKTK